MPEDAYHNAFLTGSYPQSQWSHASNGQHMNPTFIGDPAHVGSVHGGDRGAVAPEAIPTSNRPGFIGSLQAAHHPGIVGFPPGARPADNEGVDHYAAAAPQPAFTSANGLDAINYLQAAHSSGIFGFPPGARLTNNEGVSHYAATAPEPAFTSANHSGIVGSFNESFVPPAQAHSMPPQTRSVGSLRISKAAEKHRVNPRAYFCLFPLCFSQFTSRKNATRHILAHYQIKPYCCSCGARFTTNHDLNRHIGSPSNAQQQGQHKSLGHTLTASDRVKAKGAIASNLCGIDYNGGLVQLAPSKVYII